ncbi:SDR family NAD(P)-dependent oxidoreductase [Candidatus Nitrosotenuis uzonensis]|uniref:SDR family NAD(P)-dependent oxidoreductase n=1 Tax=Candidatus Nitrosotenuis uzonensis TaxID=1407055 RepID=UPI00195F3374|nr:SDR family oxidoreductase [Candidatus Nitrosotenuis uzonensis]
MTFQILKQKNCLITGATGGIGEKLAIKLAENHCNLLLTSTSRKKLLSLKQKINKMRYGIHVSVLVADLIKDNELKKIVEHARSFNHIDILVNCAGVFPQNFLNKSNLQEFDNCFNVNIRAPFFLCQEFSKHMINRKWGRIVNIGSSSSYAGFSKTSVYCASKHAILGFSRSLHEELKHHNVRTYCISPSSVKTRMGKTIKNQNYESFIDPNDVADFIVKIISYDNEMIPNEVQLKRMIVK